MRPVQQNRSVKAANVNQVAGIILIVNKVKSVKNSNAPVVTMMRIVAPVSFAHSKFAKRVVRAISNAAQIRSAKIIHASLRYARHNGPVLVV
jgi:hypothetical protein